MHANTETLKLLTDLPLFRGCSRRELRALSRLAEVIDVPAGDALIRQDERGTEFFVIVSGAAEVSRDGQVLATLGAGDFAGELALLDGKPRSASVVTTEPTRALVFAPREFWSLLWSPRVRDRVQRQAEALAPATAA